MTAPRKVNGVLRERKERQCDNKNRYPDEFTVRAQGMHQMESQGAAQLWFYRCKHCDGFHLTKFNNGPRWRI